jgi:predicted HTH domain antitoxin
MYAHFNARQLEAGWPLVTQGSAAYVGGRGLAEHWIWVHPLTMQLKLPAAVEAKLSPEDAALHLAIGLFVAEEVTLGQAAEIAGLTQAAFLKELGQRRIPIHYGPQELAEDLRVVEAFGRR